MAIIIGSYSKSAKYELEIKNATFGEICEITAFRLEEFSSPHCGEWEYIITVNGERYNWNELLKTIDEWKVLTLYDYYSIWENDEIHDVINNLKGIE